MVVVTAGHVDHGKSSLVAAITGMQPDRLPAEAQRGLTIELGYTYLRTPDGGGISFVDVPGHEKFIRTAIAGFGPSTTALLVVAADDGWMPQTAEHAAILKLLGYSTVILAISKCDLGDAAHTEQQARARLAEIGIVPVACIHTSTLTSRGIGDLSRLIVEHAGKLEPAHRAPGVRLWLDRSFQLKGRGQVVAGTLHEGSVAVGAALSHPTGVVTVLELQSNGRPVPQVTGPVRVALRLRHARRVHIGRGDWLCTPSRWRLTSELDGRLNSASAAPPRLLQAHLGTMRTAARLHHLDPFHVRLRLDREVPLVIGDVLLLRDPASRTVWSVTVLDPAPPKLPRGKSRALRARALADFPPRGDVNHELTRRQHVARHFLEQLGYTQAALSAANARELGEYLVHPDAARRWQDDLRRLAADQFPGGLRLDEVANRLRAPGRALEELIGPPLHLIAGRVRFGGLTAADHVTLLLNHTRQAVDLTRLTPVRGHDLAAQGIDRELLEWAVSDGSLLELADDHYLPEQDEEPILGLASSLGAGFSVSDFRIALGSNRRAALACLAGLETKGRIVRLPGDKRSVKNQQNPRELPRRRGEL